MAGSTLVYEVATAKMLLQTDTRAAICGGATKLVVWPEADDFQVYDLDTCRLERTIPGVDEPVFAGQVVAAQERYKDPAQKHRDYGFWDLTTGLRLATVALPDRDEGCRAISPDGRFLVLGYYAIIVLDRRTGRQVLHLSPPVRGDSFVERFTHLAFSPDGRYLAFALRRHVGVADLAHLAGDWP
jgi:WD40 repeat protein